MRIEFQVENAKVNCKINAKNFCSEKNAVILNDVIHIKFCPRVSLGIRDGFYGENGTYYPPAPIATFPLEFDIYHVSNGAVGIHRTKELKRSIDLSLGTAPANRMIVAVNAMIQRTRTGPLPSIEGVVFGNAGMANNQQPPGAQMMDRSGGLPGYPLPGYQPQQQQVMGVVAVHPAPQYQQQLQLQQQFMTLPQQQQAYYSVPNQQPVYQAVPQQQQQQVQMVGVPANGAVAMY